MSRTLIGDAVRQYLPGGQTPLDFEDPEIPNHARETLKAYHLALSEKIECAEEVQGFLLDARNWLKARVLHPVTGDPSCPLCRVPLQDIDRVGHESGCPLSHGILASVMDGSIPPPSYLHDLHSKLELQVSRCRQLEAEKSAIASEYRSLQEQVEAYYHHPLHALAKNGNADDTAACSACEYPASHPIHTQNSDNQDLTYYRNTSRLLRWVEAGAWIVVRELRRQGPLLVSEILASLRIYHDKGTCHADAWLILELMSAVGTVEYDVEGLTTDPETLGDQITVRIL